MLDEKSVRAIFPRKLKLSNVPSKGVEYDPEFIKKAIKKYNQVGVVKDAAAIMDVPVNRLSKWIKASKGK